MDGPLSDSALILRHPHQNNKEQMEKSANRRPVCSLPPNFSYSRADKYHDSRSKSVHVEKIQYSKIHENGGYHPQNGELDEILHSQDLNISLDNFHINELPNGDERLNESDAYFAGRRDVLKPDSVVESKIVSHKGTCRGFKNRVRAGINTFLLQSSEQLNTATQNSAHGSDNEASYRASEKGKIVMYTTSVAVIRETHDRCKAVKNILQNHMVRFEEKDLCMSLDNQKELMLRLHTTQIHLPQVFLDGCYLGTLEDVVRLNEIGELRSIFKNFMKIKVTLPCDGCGGYRFVPCQICHGSKKSIHRNNFTTEFCALRCMHCDEHGLVRCTNCSDEQE